MTDFRGGEGASRDYYPYITRSLLELYENGSLTNVTSVEVEPDYGYVARISYSDGSHRVTYGNDLGLNSGAAADLVTDKGHTKFWLRTIGVECPDGDEFLLPWWAETIRKGRYMSNNDAIRTTDAAASYIVKNLGYPVYVKPVNGSKGDNVYKVHSEKDLGRILASYERKRIRVAMIEEPISMPDYRIVTLDGELISAYRRNPLTVVGDGTHSIRQLIANLQEKYIRDGRDTRIDLDDPRIVQQLRRQNLDMNSYPAKGAEILLAVISNLSTGGTSEDVTSIIAPRWVNLAISVARNFGLRLCGLDLACQDITSDQASYSVLEVNSAPGLDHFASSGPKQERIVRELYAKVFNAFPATR